MKIATIDGRVVIDPVLAIIHVEDVNEKCRRPKPFMKKSTHGIRDLLVLFIPANTEPMKTLAAVWRELQVCEDSGNPFNPTAVPCSPDGGKTQFFAVEFGLRRHQWIGRIKNRFESLPHFREPTIRHYTARGALETFGYSVAHVDTARRSAA